MKRLSVIVLLLCGCNFVSVNRELQLQKTDNPSEPYRCREVLAKDGYEGTLERTKFRSAVRLDAKNLPAECK